VSHFTLTVVAVVVAVLEIYGTGDVNLDPGYIPALAANGHDYAWAALDGNDAAVSRGLGYFVRPRQSTAGSTTAIGRAIVHPDGIIEACSIPAFIENSGQPGLIDEPECGPGR
jgi:hypothetical protein